MKKQDETKGKANSGIKNETTSSTMINASAHDNMIDRYLNARMSAAERAEFEIMMLEDGNLLEQVQLVEALKCGLAEAGPVIPASAVVLPFRAWLRQPLSLAASVLVAALGLQLVQDFLTNQPPTAMPIGSTVLLEGLRSGTATPIPAAGPYLFQVDAGLGSEAEAYAVQLRDAEGMLMLEQAGLRADENGWVRFILADSLAGSYSVELIPAGATSPSRTFSITTGG